MKMDLKSSFVHGDTTSLQSTTDNRDKLANHRLTFSSQIIVVYIIIMKSLRSPDKELWLILLSSSIRYILPSPGLKFKKQSFPPSDTDSEKVKP